MRVVIGAVLIAIMGCVFTLMTAVIFVTQHLFASVVLAGLLAAAVVADRAPTPGAGASQPGSGYPAAMAGPQLPPVSRWAASEMSSAALASPLLPSLPLLAAVPAMSKPTDRSRAAIGRDHPSVVRRHRRGRRRRRRGCEPPLPRSTASRRGRR